MSTTTESDKASSAAESATQKEADDPRPDPRGSSDVTTTVAGLNLKHVEWKMAKEHRDKSFTEHESIVAYTPLDAGV